MHHELDAEFAIVSERGFKTPVANIARVTAILERAWIQLDQQNPASAIGEEHMGESRSQSNSRTAGGHLRHQLRNNNDNARGSQATGGRQQPPPGGNPRQPNHPIEDLRQKINEGRDA
jgi:hypothetical protein